MTKETRVKLCKLAQDKVFKVKRGTIKNVWQDEDGNWKIALPDTKTDHDRVAYVDRDGKISQFTSAYCCGGIAPNVSGCLTDYEVGKEIGFDIGKEVDRRLRYLRDRLVVGNKPKRERAKLVAQLCDKVHDKEGKPLVSFANGIRDYEQYQVVLATPINRPSEVVWVDSDGSIVCYRYNFTRVANSDHGVTCLSESFLELGKKVDRNLENYNKEVNHG